MLPTRRGSFHLFRFAGIDLFLHWSWFLVALYEIQDRSKDYSSLTWNVLEYVALFVIVLMHEFGHSLACRQVGGQADQIILWPLGGVAYVSPPSRAGATLWSIAAGPLVNVVLAPIILGLILLSRSQGWGESMPNAHAFLRSVWYMNLGLLIFNLLPVYPLDGGQILRSLLWYPLGRARSLTVASLVGFVGVAGVAALAFFERSIWLGILAAFIFMNCRRGYIQAKALAVVANAPRREGFTCPSCRLAPPVGPFWMCGHCRLGFDTFATQAVCPSCSRHFAVTGCPECGVLRPMEEWVASGPTIQI